MSLIVLLVMVFSSLFVAAQCPTIITSQPVSQSECYDRSVSFNVINSVGLLPTATYTWQRKRPSDGSFTNIVGDPDVTYPSPGSMLVSFVGRVNNPNQTQYQVVITDGCGTITSTPATLTVNDITTIDPSYVLPSITNVVICAGSNITYTAATVGGTPISYQWRKNLLPISDGPNYSGTDKKVLNIINATTSETGSYSIVVVFPITQPNNNPGNPSTCQQTSSLTRSLTVNQAATVNAGGPNYVCLSASPPAITLSGASVGGGATLGTWSITSSGGGTLSNTTAQNNAGIASTTYTAPSNLTTNVVLTLTTNDPDSTGPCTAVSAQRIIYPPIRNNTISAASSFLCGTDIVNISGSTTSTTPALSGGDGNYTFQWYSSDNGNSNWGPVAGQTSASYSLAQASTVRFYNRRVFSGSCESISPDPPVKINLSQIPSTPSASNNSPCNGSTLILSTPSITDATYSWTGPNSFTSTLQNPTISNVTSSNNGTYSVTVTLNGCTSSAGTTVVTINAIPAAPTSVSATPTTICEGSSTNLNATSTGNTIQWYTVSTGGSNIGTSASGANFSVSPIITTTYYAETLTPAGCVSSARTSVTVTVNTIPTITGTSPASRCGTGTVTLGATSSAGIINWYAALTGGSSLGTGTSFTIPSISSTTTYYVDASANGCTSATRTAIIATVNTPATAIAGPPQTKCSANPATTLAGTVGGGATGGTWSGGTGSFNPIATTLNAIYSPSAAEITAGTVTLTLTSTGQLSPCAAATSTMTITINASPTVNAGVAVAAICQGGTTAALGGSFGGGATAAVWSDGGAGGTFTNNSGNTPGTTVYKASATAPATVTLTLTTSGGSCGTISATKNISINPKPAPIIIYHN